MKNKEEKRYKVNVFGKYETIVRCVTQCLALGQASAALSCFSAWCLFLLVRGPKGHNFPWMIERYPNVTHVAVFDISGH